MNCPYLGPENHLCEKEMTNELWHWHLFCKESKLCVLFSPTLQILHMFYELNFLPPTLNTLICFPIFPNVFCKTKYESELNGKTSNSMGLVWSGGRIFVVMQTCNLYSSECWCFSECTGCLTVHYWSRLSPIDLHTFQHELSHLAEENTNIHKWEHAQQQDWIGNTRNKKKDKDAWHILHRTGFLTRLQW